MSEDELRPWHRLFGIALTDLFAGTPFRVELEKELALRSQLLDVVIIQNTAGDLAAARTGLELPDGLEGLRAHNLLTYKSQHEALDGWALEELIGHYANYRKLTPARDDRRKLLPEENFQLYAVATRFPDKLKACVSFEETAWDGIFDLAWGTRRIRLIVLAATPKHPRNAPWELFSARMDRIRHGVEHYRARNPQTAALLHELYLRYQLELPTMAYTLEDFVRDSNRHILERLTPEERQAFLEKIPPEERLRGLRPEERLRGLPPEELLRVLPPEALRKLKDRLDQLSATGESTDSPG